MKAIRFHRTGDPEVLHLEEIEDPAPGDGEVLVRAYAAGVNPIDITTRQGRTTQLDLPAGLGRDTSGVVEAVGKGVTSVTTGAKVIVYNITNGYSELVVAPQDKLFPVPEGLGLIEAASIGVTYNTAWDAVVNKADVQSGQTVLVQGASGGVGVAAVQIAKALGATVIGTASTEEKRRWVRSQGADHVVDYTRDDWPEKVKMLTSDSKGIDAIIDGVGGSAFVKAFECLAPGGVISVFGESGGHEITFDLTMLRRARARVLGASRAGASREDFVKLLDLFRQGKLKPTVERTLPLADAAEAHKLIENRVAIGKIILTVP